MIILYIITLFGISILLGSAGYVFKGWFKWLYHDILKWHIPKEDSIISDGFIRWGVCKYCDEVIQQDSQGNWF